MTRGRKPQPTALKVLHGNPGKRTIRNDEPRPECTLPPCPEHVTGLAREAWSRFSEQLYDARVLTQLDAAALEMLCTAYAEAIEAGQQVAKYGAVWLESKPGEKIPKFVYSPYWAVRNRAEQRLHAMLCEFGMTPSSRSKVAVAAKEQSSDPFGDFLSRGKSG